MEKLKLTHQYFLRIADPPCKIAHCAVSLHNFWCEFNAKPVNSLVIINRKGGGEGRDLHLMDREYDSTSVLAIPLH